MTSLMTDFQSTAANIALRAAALAMNGLCEFM